MKQLPELSLVLVAQPYNLIGCEIPGNVKVYCDIPRTEALNILKHSQFMALPLETNETSCGHITLVSAMFCHKAIVATGSTGIADYLPPDYAAPRVAAGDVDGWVKTLREMAKDPHGSNDPQPWESDSAACIAPMMLLTAARWTSFEERESGSISRRTSPTLSIPI